MATFRIDVVIDPKTGRGTAKIKSELDGIEKKAKRTQKAVGLLKKAFVGLGAGLAVREFIRLSDTLTNVQNRLKLVTDSENDLIETQERLFEVANATRSSFEGTATIFGRLAQSADELGRTNEQLLSFTERLNKAIILSGASAAESSAGLIQLSQGLASGALRGDELRSVLEQLPAVARVIAKDLGITIGQLRELGQQGKITSDVIIGAFERAGDKIDEDFGKTVPTIGQAFQVLTNAVIESIGVFNEATGSADLLAKGLIKVAEGTSLAAEGFKDFGQLVREFFDIQTDFQGFIEGRGRDLAKTQAAFDKLTATIADQRFVTIEQNKQWKELRDRLRALKGATEPIVDVQEELNEGLDRQREILEKLEKPEKDRLQRIRDLRAILDRGEAGESIALIVAELDKLESVGDAQPDRITSVVTNLRKLQDIKPTEFSAGVVGGLRAITEQAMDLEAVGEAIVFTFQDAAVDALQTLAREGEINFREFGSALLDQIADIIIQLLVAKAIAATLGPGTTLGGLLNVGSLTPSTNAGRQGGGTVQPGQAPFPVNENGQELFVPNRTGTIVPNAADVKQAPPQVNVQLVTVQSEDMVPEAIASGAADEALIQRVGANPDRFGAVGS